MRTGDRLRYGPQVVSRRRPRRWLVTDKRGPMSPRSPRSPRRGLRPRVRVEAPTRAQAHEETGWQSLSSQAELDGVVPRSAGADRPAGSGGERTHLPEPGAHLLGRDQIAVLSWEDAAHAQGSGPTRAAARDLHQPRGVPARHHRLPMRLPVRLVGGAPLGTGFRVTPGPDTGVNGKPGRLRFQWVRRCQSLETRQVHAARVERLVAAAPPAVAGGRQTQVRGCFERWRAQHGVERREQGVASTPKQRVHVLTEGSERFPFWRVHTQKDGLSSLSLSTPSHPYACCGLKCKLILQL